MQTNFIFNNKEYNYFNHEYNSTRFTERAVEIPISFDFINQKTEIIEIGCVLPYYMDTEHEVIDLVDTHPKAKNVDAIDVNYKNKNVLSISTVEHVGLNDYGIESKEKDSSIKLCQKIMDESTKYFITWPLGYNPHLDKWGFTQNASFISRNKNDPNSWIQKNFSELMDTDFLYGTYRCANSIIILTNDL